MSNDLDNGYAVLQTSCIANDVEGKKVCNSSDALTIYEHEGEDGVWYDSYCYSCNQFFNKEQTHNSQVAIELGIKDGEVVEKKKFNPLPKSQPLKKEEVIEFIKKIGYEGKNYRSLKDEYNKFYGHLTKLDSTGKPIARYYPETKDGVVVGYKCRNFPKNFSHGKLGVTGISNDMSGQVKFKSGGRYVLIVGGECYSEDTEVLTPAGWKVFRELTQEDLVMQVEDGVGVFVKPLDYVVKEHNGVLLNYKSKFNDLLVTPKHKMVSLDFNKKEYTHTAEDLPRSKGHSYRKSVWYEGSGVPLTDDQIKFIIAVAADSKVDTRKSGKRVAHFSFIKERKIIRLKNILEKLDLDYTEFDKSVHDWACGRKYHTFNVTLPEWVIEKGLPLNWLQDLNFKQKTLVLDEIILWDGNLVKGRDSFEFSSKLKHEAELVANLAITNNQHANISFRKNDLGEWFVVKVSRNKTTASYQRVIVTEVNYTGKVYCVTVPSGKILVRRNGKVVVCGNCDKVAAYQMLREDQITRKQGEYEAIAVVSPTTGEPSAYKQVANNYEFFDSFDIIVVGMDSDDKGTEAAYAVAKMLPSDKVRIAKWSSKDPNKMLEEGKQKQFVRDFYNAKPFVSVGIKSAADAMSEVSDFLNSPKIGLPPHLHRLQENMRGGIKSTGAIVNIIGHTSIGKCLGKDTPILMYDFSIKKVQDVCVGDLIMGDDGTARNVLSLANGTELMYEVKQNNGITYTVNSSHILSLRAGFTTPQYKKGEIVNINVEDYINSSKTNKRSLKGYKGDFRKYNVTQQEESKAYLLGLWLAEGTEVASEVTIHKELFDILQEEVYNAGYSITIKKEYNLCITCYIKGGFKAWLRSIGVLGKKHFPSYLMQCTPNTRYNAIAGYLDGDGFKVSNGYEVTAKQDLLSSTFMELCKSVSLQVTNRKVEKSCQNNFSGIYNRMFVFGKTNEIPNKLTRKKVDTKSKLREHNNTKITVTKLKEDEYFGFVIDGNHLFCLGDGTVTHNTLFTDTLIYDWVFNSPVMPTILSLERTAGELLIDLYSLHLKKNLTWFSDGQDAIDYLDTPEVKVLCENLVYKEDGTPRFYIIDERSASVETLKKQVDKTRKQNNSNFIICDPLTDFLRSLPLEDQENFMMYQKLLKKDGVVFINVLHTRKPSSDKEGKARDVSEYDVLGSGSFVQSADINIVLNRDKMAENPTERNTTYVSMPKCRGGTTGLACKIYYDPETRQVYDYDDRFNTTPEVSIIVDEEGEDIQIQF